MSKLPDGVVCSVSAGVVEDSDDGLSKVVDGVVSVQPVQSGPVDPVVGVTSLKQPVMVNVNTASSMKIPA